MLARILTIKVSLKSHSIKSPKLTKINICSSFYSIFVGVIVRIAVNQNRIEQINYKEV